VRSANLVPSQLQFQTTGRISSEINTNNNRTKSYLLQKVQALLPYLSEILRQNDARTSGIVGKLSNLKDNLDGMFEDIDR